MKEESPQVLRVHDNPFFKNIDAICEAFGVPVKSVHLGYMRRSSAIHPSRPNIHLWWPSENHAKWDNRLSGNGMTFTSCSRKGPFSTAGIIDPDASQGLTAIFFRKVGHPYGYRFVGLFKTNVDESVKRHMHVYDRVSTELEI